MNKTDCKLTSNVCPTPGFDGMSGLLFSPFGVVVDGRFGGACLLYRRCERWPRFRIHLQPLNANNRATVMKFYTFNGVENCFEEDSKGCLTKKGINAKNEWMRQNSSNCFTKER